MDRFIEDPILFPVRFRRTPTHRGSLAELAKSSRGRYTRMSVVWPSRGDEMSFLSHPLQQAPSQAANSIWRVARVVCTFTITNGLLYECAMRRRRLGPQFRFFMRFFVMAALSGLC